MSEPAIAGATPAAIHVARGPLALEDHLLGCLGALIDAARAQPALLGLPVRVVVPSRSLADHLGREIVARQGRSVAGVLVQTLFGVALELVEHSAEPPCAPDALFPVLVRRLAAEEPLLREALGDLVDGYASVEAAVEDLLDAGFDAACAEGAGEAIGAARGSPAALLRAQAVARVALRCCEEMERQGVGHRTRLLRAAREALVAAPAAALPARAVLVHGFADATGLRAELIEALVRYRHASVWIDEPPDPARRGASDVGARFGERLRTRLLGAAPLQRLAPEPQPAPGPAYVEAVSPDAEVRAVAVAVREALDAGTLPERIGVVARRLPGYRAALGLHFGRLGIPFSSESPGGAGPLARRASALDALLREGDDCRTERWLEACAAAARPGAAAVLRLRLRRLSLVRLRDVAACEAASGELRSLVAAARATCAQLARIAKGGAADEQLARLEALLAQGLGWPPAAEAVAPLREALARLAGALPAGFALAAEELALLLRRQLARGRAQRFGGEGGGVQILDVTQARGRTFDALFVLGLLRDGFPRSVREEALLPDFVRESLRDVLPDVPLKQLGHDEERFLFAQLVASSPQVTLCWPVAGEDGRARARSSFIERLRWGERSFAPARGSSVLSRGASRPPRSLAEHALFAALHAGTGPRLAELLPLALGELAPPVDPEALAQARLRVIEEFELGGRSARLGPYYGFVGAARGAADPRARPLYVTHLQDLARCGWQTFVRRLLEIRPQPDAQASLPGSDARLLGATVHRTLAVLASATPGGEPRWPEPAELEALAREQAAQVLEEEDVALPALARVLALQALPLLARTRELDAAEGARLHVIAAEQERASGITDARGGTRELRFRVDRIERIDGAERLTDFKTGRPPSTAKAPATRWQHFVRAVARGEALQPFAYALAAGAGGSGRLLFVNPERAPEAAAAGFVARCDDAELASAFEAAVHALLAAWDTGGFLPVLVGPDLDEAPAACRFCDVAQACLQGDTGARRRLAAWLEARSRQGLAGLSEAEQALFALYQLRVKPGAEVESA